MKTDDRSTRQRNEVDGDEAKVVRLSDWLAPEDELVPFGPRAYAAEREPAEAGNGPDRGMEPPAASGFWDGDTSVHTAVPGPGIFDEPGERTAGRRRSRRLARVWRPALPPLHPFDWPSRPRARLALTDRLSWRWAAAGGTLLALALIAVVITLGSSPAGRHETAAQAGIAEPAPAALSGTLGAIGTATRTAAVSDLRRLPRVETAGRAIGTAAAHARALQARPRPHAVVPAASVPSSSPAASVETPTTTSAPAPVETTPAPSETEPSQSTSSHAPVTGGGSSSGAAASSSNSHKQSNFGATGSLGPGSSPNG